MTIRTAAITLHLVLLILAGLPDPATIYSLRGRSDTADSTPVRRALSPIAGHAALGATSAFQSAWHRARPVLTLARRYTRLLGLQQDWRMFANPPLTNTYLVARYHFSNAAGSGLATREELLFPAQQHRIRNASAFMLSYRDKAIANALGAYDEAAREFPGDTRRPTAFGFDPLGAVSRWASARLTPQGLGPDVQLRQTELWRAEIAIRRPGVEVSPGAIPTWHRVDAR